MFRAEKSIEMPSFFLLAQIFYVLTKKQHLFIVKTTIENAEVYQKGDLRDTDLPLRINYMWCFIAY